MLVTGETGAPHWLVARSAFLSRSLSPARFAGDPFSGFAISFIFIQLFPPRPQSGSSIIVSPLDASRRFGSALSRPIRAMYV